MTEVLCLLVLHRLLNGPAKAESLLVDAVALSELSARLDPPLTMADEPDSATLVQGAALPARGAAIPLQLLAGAGVQVHVELVEDTSDRVVGWNQSAGALELEALAGRLPGVRGVKTGFTARGGTAAGEQRCDDE